MVSSRVSGTLVMWNNENTQHYLVQDLEYYRLMHRVMVKTAI